MPMRGLLAFPLLVAVVAWPSADTARPLKLAAPARVAKVSVGLVGDLESARLARLDETTLAAVPPLGPRLGGVDAWAFSPDRGRVAIASHPRGAGIFRDSIRLANLGTLRLARKPVVLRGMTRALLWSRPDRIVALVIGDSTWSSVVAIDVAARRVVSTKVLEGDVTAIARTGDALVLLLTPPNAIGAPTLAVVDASGGTRSVSLSRLSAGRNFPQDSPAMIGTQRLPAVAVDAAANRAYVVAPDEPAADVDLQSLAVSYHDVTVPHSVLAHLLAWLQPPAEAKGLNGPVWHAQWLGDGLIALVGITESATASGNSLTLTTTPAGLAIVDTHDWTMRMLDKGATEVTPAAGILLATGATWSSASEDTHGMGLAAYGSDRELRYRLWPGTSAWVQAVWAGRAYVQVTNGGTATIHVVDVASGKIVGQRTSMPTPLLVDGPDS